MTLRKSTVLWLSASLLALPLASSSARADSTAAPPDVPAEVESLQRHLAALEREEHGLEQSLAKDERVLRVLRQRVVARQYNVSRADLLSSRRTANVVRPRQIAMYLAKTLTLRSLPEIGRRFGGRDHTTVLHAVRKIENLVGNDVGLAEEIEILKRLLQE